MEAASPTSTMEAATLGRNNTTSKKSVSVRLYKTQNASSKLNYREGSTLTSKDGETSTAESRKNVSRRRQPPLHALGCRIPSSRQAVFDRLYNAHTISSRLKCRERSTITAKDGETSTAESRKKVSRRRQPPLHAPAPALAPPPLRFRDDSQRLSVKPRKIPLYKPPVASSKLKCEDLPLSVKPRKITLYKPPAASSELLCEDLPLLIATDGETSSVESDEKLSRRKSRASTPELADTAPALRDDSQLLNVNLRTTLLYNKKYDPEATFLDISSALASLNLIQTIVDYEANRLTERQVAGNIINALFTRDFPPCKRWEINPFTAEELDVGVFAVEKHATWDWQENYSVTQAKAVIRFGEDEIRVEEYSFFRCWLKFGGKSCKKMFYGFQKKEKDAPMDAMGLLRQSTSCSPNVSGEGRIAIVR
jgi:hypothetical protein